MDLAEDLGGGRYRPADGLEDTLRRMSERGDIIRLIQRELTARWLDRPGVDQAVTTELHDQVVGRLIQRGFSDEYRDRRYVMIDGVDGRVHYVDIGRGDAVPSLPDNATVRIDAVKAGVTQADRAIDTIAGAHGGRYSIDLHLRHDPQAGEAFATSHVRRLEAMRRAGAGPERLADGSWLIPEDHLARAEAFAHRQLRDRPAVLALLSTRDVSDLAAIEGPTWLDQELAAGVRRPARDVGFGREVRAALEARRLWLVEQQLGHGEGREFRLQTGALEDLGNRALRSAGSQLALQLAKPFSPAWNGERVEGVIARPADLEGGSYALVERSRDFTLVPWRDVLGRNIGKAASGIMRPDGSISWRCGRDRASPSIS